MPEYYETKTTEKLTAIALDLGLGGTVVRDDESTQGRYILQNGNKLFALGDSKAQAKETLEELASKEKTKAIEPEEDVEVEEALEITYPAHVRIEVAEGLVDYMVLSPDPFKFCVRCCNKAAIENKAYFKNPVNAAKLCVKAGIPVEVPDEPEIEEE